MRFPNALKLLSRTRPNFSSSLFKGRNVDRHHHLLTTTAFSIPKLTLDVSRGGERGGRRFPNRHRWSSTSSSNRSQVQPYRTHPPRAPKEPTVHTFFHTPTSSWTYVVIGSQTSDTILIDPVLDFDPDSNEISTESADDLLLFLRQRGLRVTTLLETHAHADHLSSCRYLQSKLEGSPPICIGEGILEVRKNFAERYDLKEEGEGGGGGFDRLLKEGDEVPLGDQTSISVLHLPGHTPDHLGYLVGNNLFSGDVVFLPDVGSARADFPGGSASQLYTSLSRVLSLPEETRLYVGHDYPPPTASRTRRVSCFSTVGESRRDNIHLGGGGGFEQFVEWRKRRDSQLGPPRLLHQSLQVNLRAGRIPYSSAKGEEGLTPLFRVPSGLEEVFL